jgi:PadR family transcriptional regulator, regulatory protein PadR
MNYGTAIIERIAQHTGQRLSAGAVYTSLNRLEKKGFVSSLWGEPVQERGGRRKRIYTIAAAGLAAVDRTYAALSAIDQSWQATA